MMDILLLVLIVAAIGWFLGGHTGARGAVGCLLKTFVALFILAFLLLAALCSS